MPPVEHIEYHDIVPFDDIHNSVIPNSNAVFFGVRILEWSYVCVGTRGQGIVFETGQGISYPHL